MLRLRQALKIARSTAKIATIEQVYYKAFQLLPLKVSAKLLGQCFEFPLQKQQQKCKEEQKQWHEQGEEMSISTGSTSY